MIEQILKETEEAVAKRAAQRSLTSLEAQAKPTTRRLGDALKSARSAMILECKKASPSQGLIRPDFDIAAIVKAYDPFASAISVITNARFFEGSLDFLSEARKHTQRPLLCKDFILTPYQVVEARVHEADAVLLMMSLLDDRAFEACAQKARALNMDVLVEVHDEAELERALSHRAHIIGVNNRDFRTLKVDMMTAERLLPHIPKGVVRVFESGVSEHQHLLRYRGFADAFLVGTSLMRQSDLPRAVRELIFGRVKVCGLTRHEDAMAAYHQGAVYGGLIFAPESPRCVTLNEAERVRKNCPLAFVGVFVNQPAAMIADHVRALSLSAVQLHGEEKAGDIRALRSLLPESCEIWKAIRVKDKLPSIEVYGCDRLVLDAYAHDRRGGTGQRFDWALLGQIKDKERYILSGGLSDANAREADAQGLWALDVNSGVESAPGIKSDKALHNFFLELR